MSETSLKERVARAIALEILTQDGIENDSLNPDLTIDWLDQGTVDFGIVATAAINLVLDEAAMKLEGGDDGHDWSPAGAAAAIRALKEPS